MKKAWRTLGLCVGLSLVGCGGDGGGGEGNGNGSSVCTGSYSGAVTGRVRFCSLEAVKHSDGQLQYSLSVEPESGSGTITKSHTVLLFATGEPQKGTYGSDFTQMLGTLEATDGKEYSLRKGVGTDLGSATLTVDSVPAGQQLSGSTLYQWFGGKAQLKYVADPSAGHTGEVNLTLTFTPQE